MDFVTLVTLKLTAKEIGTDQFGNRYYEERRARAGKPPRRYVRYNGIVEASKVPAEWHGWLHHTVAVAPSIEKPSRKVWEKTHRENRTGSAFAYHPLGENRTKPVNYKDYEAWLPDNEK